MWRLDDIAGRHAGWRTQARRLRAICRHGPLARVQDGHQTEKMLLLGLYRPPTQKLQAL